MKVLVINCGSSSLKYQLIDMDGEKVLKSPTSSTSSVSPNPVSYTRRKEETHPR